jgi:hypothetical protein
MSHQVRFVVWWLDTSMMKWIIEVFVDAKELCEFRKMLDREEIQYTINKEIIT